jgi:hypothetical protein
VGVPVVVACFSTTSARISPGLRVGPKAVSTAERDYINEPSRAKLIGDEVRRRLERDLGSAVPARISRGLMA